MASELYIMNPVKKRRKKAAKRSPKRSVKRASAKTRRTPTLRQSPISAKKRVVRRKAKRASGFFSQKRKRRSSKSGGIMRGLNFKNFAGQLQTGAINGAGAFTTDIVLGFVRPMLPQVMGFGPMRHVTRVALGLLLSNLVGKLSPRFGNAIAIGTATVAGFDFVKEFVGPMLPPGIVLGEYTEQMGEYVDQMGYINPAQVQGMGETPAYNNESSYYAGGG